MSRGHRFSEICKHASVALRESNWHLRSASIFHMRYALPVISKSWDPRSSCCQSGTLDLRPQRDSARDPAKRAWRCGMAMQGPWVSQATDFFKILVTKSSHVSLPQVMIGCIVVHEKLPIELRRDNLKMRLEGRMVVPSKQWCDPLGKPEFIAFQPPSKNLHPGKSEQSRMYCFLSRGSSTCCHCWGACSCWKRLWSSLRWQMFPSTQLGSLVHRMAFQRVDLALKPARWRLFQDILASAYLLSHGLCLIGRRMRKRGEKRGTRDFLLDIAWFARYDVRPRSRHCLLGSRGYCSPRPPVKGTWQKKQVRMKEH